MKSIDELLMEMGRNLMEGRKFHDYVKSVKYRKYFNYNGKFFVYYKHFPKCTILIGIFPNYALVAIYRKLKFIDDWDRAHDFMLAMESDEDKVLAENQPPYYRKIFYDVKELNMDWEMQLKMVNRYYKETWE